MTFIGQIRIEGPLFGNPQPFRMAYLFMTDLEDGEGVDLQTNDPDAGENAVVIQPGHYPGPARWRQAPRLRSIRSPTTPSPTQIRRTSR